MFQWSYDLSTITTWNIDELVGDSFLSVVEESQSDEADRRNDDECQQW